ncbi:MAG: glycosyltransferase, partial [Cyanobacteriota bacterium]
KDYELIIVNDQSEDATEFIVNNYMDKFPQLQYLKIDKKPDEWVGKNYALNLGQKYSSSEMLLFIDADVRLSEKCLEKSCNLFIDNNINILSYAAYQECKTIYEYSLQPIIFWVLNLLYPLRDISNAKKSVAACNGIFIMIDRQTYLKIGTHEAVKSEILEDVELAKKAKKSGAKIVFSFAPELIKVRMYRNFQEIFDGWSKNIFALCEYSIIKSMLIVLLLLLLFNVPLLLVILGLAKNCIIIFWMIIVILYFMYVYHKMGYSAIVALLFPLGSLILPLIIINSIFRYKVKGSVKWKNRLYKVKKSI